MKPLYLCLNYVSQMYLAKESFFSPKRINIPPRILSKRAVYKWPELLTAQGSCFSPLHLAECKNMSQFTCEDLSPKADSTQRS